ncbi:MAG TPA: hypothetical protein DCP07_01260 [Lachnospiraceae bacterium]|nr:hypothetical protein [Lachnospiraceae bacterium]
MKEYMREDMDSRKIAILTLKKIWLAFVIAIVTAGLFLGIYLLKTKVFNGADVYRSDALYKIDFDDEKYDSTIIFYNDYTWNDVIDADIIAGKVAEKTGLSKEDIAAATSVPTMSDITLFHVYVDASDSSKAEAIQAGLEETLAEFADGEEGFVSITKWDQKKTYIYKDASHAGRVAVFGFVIGLIIGYIVVRFMVIIGQDTKEVNDEE